MINKLDAAAGPGHHPGPHSWQVELDNDDEFGIEMGFQSPILFDRSNDLQPDHLADDDDPQPDDVDREQRLC